MVAWVKAVHAEWFQAMSAQEEEWFQAMSAQGGGMVPGDVSTRRRSGSRRCQHKEEEWFQAMSAQEGGVVPGDVSTRRRNGYRQCQHKEEESNGWHSFLIQWPKLIPSNPRHEVKQRSKYSTLQCGKRYFVQLERGGGGGHLWLPCSYQWE